MVLRILLLCSLLGAALPGLAIDSQSFNDYTVDYTTFPSTALQADIAAHYGIKRSEYETLLNVFVSKEGQQGGVEVKIKGTAKNLMAQQQVLKFLEIKEDNTVYYIAAIRVTNEDTMHFKLLISPENSSDEFEINFTKTLYKD